MQRITLKPFPVLVWVSLLALTVLACSNNDNAHTTATTFVSPPPRQVLKTEFRDGPREPARFEPGARVDPNKPLLILNLEDGKTLKEGEELVFDFSLANVKLKGDGGEYRVRYFVDDGEMQWLDHWQEMVLSGWTSGKHTVRMELIGPDGWPYRNGNFNVVTKEIIVVGKT